MAEETIVCQKCGTINPSTNNFCSNCAAPLKESAQSTPEVAPVPTVSAPVPAKKKKGHGCLITLAIVVGIIILIIIIAVATSSDNKSKVVDSNNSTVSTSAKPSSGASSSSSAGPQIFAVGQTVKNSNVEMTVNKVEHSDGGDYDKPSHPGDEFVIVTITMKNDGTSTASYNPLDFKMQNSDGQLTDMAITGVNDKTDLQSGDLASGGHVTGTIAFEEPKGDKGLMLQYQGNFWDDSTIVKFKLN